MRRLVLGIAATILVLAGLGLWAIGRLRAWALAPPGVATSYDVVYRHVDGRT